MKLLVLILSLLAAAPAAADKLYRWVDETGRVHYSDQAPPPRARNAIQKNYKGSVIESGESYALRQAKGALSGNTLFLQLRARLRDGSAIAGKTRHSLFDERPRKQR